MKLTLELPDDYVDVMSHNRRCPSRIENIDGLNKNIPCHDCCEDWIQAEAQKMLVDKYTQRKRRQVLDG